MSVTLLTEKYRPRNASVFPRLVGAWFLVYFGARALLEQADLRLPLKLAAAIVPAVVFAIVLIVAVRAIRRADELEQRIHLLATAIAFTLVALFILLFGLLDRAAILSRQSLTDVFPIFTSCYVVAYVAARMRYHREEPEGADSAASRGAS